MKTVIIALLALGVAAGSANARTVFDDLRDTAPRTVFDDLRHSAPRAPFDELQDSAPRSDGVFGDLERNAP